MCEPRLGGPMGRIRKRGLSRTSGRFGAERDRPGPVLAPPSAGLVRSGRPWHGQHDDAGHHVLDPAVGLVLADAAAELLRQRVAVERQRVGDPRAQQRHLRRHEVAAVVAALDRNGHVGAVSSRRRAAAPARPDLRRPQGAVLFAVAARGFDVVYVSLGARRHRLCLSNGLAQTLPPRLERQGNRPPPRALRPKRVVADEDYRPGFRPRANSPFVRAQCSRRP